MNYNTDLIGKIYRFRGSSNCFDVEVVDVRQEESTLGNENWGIGLTLKVNGEHWFGHKFEQGHIFDVWGADGVSTYY